jgi:hypothetical protein
MQMPAILLGYEKDVSDAHVFGSNSDETMIYLFITLDPLLPQPETLRPKVIILLFIWRLSVDLIPCR